MGQSWFSAEGTKLTNVGNILAGLAAFKADSVRLPEGLEEVVLAEEFDFNSCMKRFKLDWEETNRRIKQHATMQTRPEGEQFEGRCKEFEACIERHPYGPLPKQNATDPIETSLALFLNKSTKEEIMERHRVVKSAWVSGGGSMGQSWFSAEGTKLTNVGNILAGLAAFKADSVRLPEGLEEVVFAEEFDFNSCMKRFKLDWEETKRRIKQHAAMQTRPEGEQFEGRCKELEAWIERHPDGPLPKQNATDPIEKSLALFLITSQRTYREGLLSSLQMDRLCEIP